MAAWRVPQVFAEVCLCLRRCGDAHGVLHELGVYSVMLYTVAVAGRRRDLPCDLTANSAMSCEMRIISGFQLSTSNIWEVLYVNVA